MRYKLHSHAVYHGWQRTIRSILSEERPQHATLSSPINSRVVQRINQRRDSKDIREEDEFLAGGCARLSRAREELDRRHPFVCCDASCR